MDEVVVRVPTSGAGATTTTVLTSSITKAV